MIKVVGYYVMNGIVYKEVSSFDVDIEALWIEVNLPHTKTILLGTVYRPPNENAEYLSKLDYMFQHSTSQYEDVIVLRDFNLDLCKRANCTKINNIAKHSNLTQLIKNHTRITDTSSTILDLIFVTNSDKVFSSGVHSLGLSDHSLIYLIRKNKKVHMAPRTIKSRSFKNFNDKDFVDTVKNMDWDKVTSSSDVDSAWTNWGDLFNEACDKHAPVKEKRVSGSLHEWINSEYIQLSKDRTTSFQKHIRLMTPMTGQQLNLLEIE